jgi:hypothetical protein
VAGEEHGRSCPRWRACSPRAVVGDDAWLWRDSLGPVGKQEPAAWWHTAVLVADLVDNLVLAGPGAFARMASRVVIDAEKDDPGLT